MYDCLTDSYEENIRKVKEITKLAHLFGATVEAELGHVGDNEGDSALERPEDYYTDPDMAKDFTDRTGVDALAIAVGTAHGLYKFKPKLDFERITKIKNAIGIPLVLHGGSDFPERIFRRRSRTESVKLIFLQISISLRHRRLPKALADGKTAMTDIILYQVEAVAEATKAKMELFGCVGRG